jgi:hypothetical protein
MAIENIPLPETHPTLRDYLSALEPGALLVVGRLGARHYEKVVTLTMHADPEHTRDEVSKAVVANVQAHGDASFIVITDEQFRGKKYTEGVRWFAFARLPTDDLGFGDAKMVPAALVRWVQRIADRHVEVSFEDRKQSAGITKDLADALKTVITGFTEREGKIQDMLAEALQTIREGASAQNELALQLAKLEASAKIREKGLEMLEDYVGSMKAEGGDVSKILAKIAELLGPEDEAALKEAKEGAALFAARNFTSLRNAGIAVRKALMSGALKVSADALARVMPFVNELIG